MERAVLLQILDNAWKDHLLAMDHLRSSVGLRGYAQVDPKVEYKREGMRTFDLMWKGIDDRVTDIVYRIEQVEDDALKSTWHDGRCACRCLIGGHVAASLRSRGSRSQPGDTSGDSKAEPIRNMGQKSRPQQSLPMRERQEVQELLRPLRRRHASPGGPGRLTPVRVRSSAVSLSACYRTGSLGVDCG